MSNTDGKSEERRNYERHPIMETTSLTVVTDGGRFPCVVEDLSFGGVKLRFEAAVPDVDELRLEHPLAGTFVGRCVWQGDDIIGVEFDQKEREIEQALQCVALMVTPDAALSETVEAAPAPRSGIIKGGVA